MDLNRYTFDRAERYLQGEMPEEERQQFEQAMNDDEGLHKKVLMHRLADEGIGLIVEENIRERLEVIKSRKRQAADQGPVIRRRVWRAGAAAAVLLLAGFSYLQLNWSDRALAARFAQAPITAIQPERGSDGSYAATGELQDQYLQAHDWQAQGEYKRASMVYASIIQRLPSDQQWVDAKELEWNLMVTTLGAGDDEEAIRMLESMIAQPNHPYRARAETLLNQLNSGWRLLTF